MNFKVILKPSDEGGYTVYVPSLQGCVSEGNDIDEALKNIREAIEFYLEPIEENISIEDGNMIKELVL
jgi:predicted RNase H-like HicB family nuclease